MDDTNANAAATVTDGIDLQHIAETALELMKSQGFDDAQVGAQLSVQDELNIAHSEPSLLRSTEKHNLTLVGLLDGRKASTELTDTDTEAMRQAVKDLFDSVQVAPQDEANTVSSGHRIAIEQGPGHGDLDILARKVRELLDYRAANTQRIILEEGQCAHIRSQRHILTSRGSELRARLGYYTMAVVATAKDGKDASSVNFRSGCCHDLEAHHAATWFGIGAMLQDTERQIHTRALDEGFVGDVVLSPTAVGDLLRWLLGQVTDFQLLADSSLYRNRVGDSIAAPLLSVRSRFDAPGTCAITEDACVAEPIQLVTEGRLNTLLPSLYGSRKTGLPHVPSADAGWSIDAGPTPRDEIISGVTRGALVGRLSMGMPAANGDMAGVIKNSFLIDDGAVGPALAEVMIAGNIANMLRDIVAISAERMDRGVTALPWIRIANLHFS